MIIIGLAIFKVNAWVFDFWQFWSFRPILGRGSNSLGPWRGLFWYFPTSSHHTPSTIPWSVQSEHCLWFWDTSMYEWIRVRVCTCVCTMFVHAHVCVRVHACFAPPDKDASLYPQVLWFFLLMLLLLLSLASSPSFLLFSLVLSPSDWLNVIWPSGKWINQQTEWLPDEWAFQVPHTPLAVNSLDSAFHHKGSSFFIQK